MDPTRVALNRHERIGVFPLPVFLESRGIRVAEVRGPESFLRRRLGILEYGAALTLDDVILRASLKIHQPQVWPLPVSAVAGFVVAPVALVFRIKTIRP